MHRPSRILVALLTLALAALGVAACGGGESSSSGNADAQALLKDTFGPDHPIRSGKLDLSLDLDLKGLPQLDKPVAIKLTGPFQSNGAGKLPNFNFALELASGDRPVTLGAISTGRKGYLSIEGQAFDLGSDAYASFKKGYADAQAKSGSKGAVPSLKSLGIAPMRWLRAPQTTGTEDIAGTTTTHVTSDVDVPKLLADVAVLLDKAKGLKVGGASPIATSLSPDQQRRIGQAVKSAKVDLWVGQADKTLRKLAVDVVLDVPQDQRASMGGLQGGHVAFQFTIADLNKAQTIAEPKDARPMSDLQQVLQQLFGSAASGSSSSGSSTTTTPAEPAPATGPQKAYLDCITKAGTDVGEIQQCAGLLN
jgi:hypothetical protein